jgi:protein-L-isoaspartate(D-aspartate) O-methyltransferase
MIDAADVRAGNRVLEVGTGYGFQTALLVELEAEVTSIERFPALARDAAANLRRTGKAKAHLEVGDGWGGVAARAPFDAIIVSAEASRVPPRLAEQLAEGGRLVIPLRSEAHGAAVFLLGKTDGALAERRLLTPARFVPLVPFSDSGA